MDATAVFWYGCTVMEGSTELKEIKKEIVEARGLIIKSNNLANSLGTEIRSIAKRQVSYERHLAWNSIIAYVIFTILVFAAVQLTYNQRQASLASSLNAERARADKAEKALSVLDREKKADSKSQGAELMALYDLIHNGDREASIAAYEKLDKTRLSHLESKLLDDTIQGFASDLSMQHYVKGLDLLAAQKFPEAVEELRTSLRLKDDAGHSPAAKIQLANALRLQGKPREAIAILQRLIEEHLDRDLSDDAYWYLALAHYEAHQRDEAKSVLRALMRQFPDSQYFRAARTKAAEIQLHLYSEE